ncbi:MAG: helix-turn-helix domain-containing protein [Pleurocapsa minor GSE-CHR-MK-17-07R]|jgi:transcriptional regulator with XRE-family HTH domain|nr:helix-turn-helix domain-containing protein [Pleurocapsa minor GSE-CHR-MK 17-07R]MBW4435897.1 helix-turn-helix domain-containing protein [Pleurocapsa minor GSE-CHR-MK 17-07R]
MSVKGREIFGERLREAREALGLTQVQVAIMAGVNQVTINKFESGERDNPTLENLSKLAEALKTTPDFLLGYSGAGDDKEFALNARERAVINAWRRGIVTEAIRLMVQDTAGGGNLTS